MKAPLVKRKRRLIAHEAAPSRKTLEVETALRPPTSQAMVRKLLAERNPQWSVDEIEHVLNRVLSELISWETVTRLSRSKDKRIELAL